MCEAVFLSSVSVLCELCVTFPPVPEEASVPGGVPGDQKAQKVVTKYHLYTRNFLCGILSSNAFASVSDRVCALLRNVLENY